MNADPVIEWAVGFAVSILALLSALFGHVHTRFGKVDERIAKVDGDARVKVAEIERDMRASMQTANREIWEAIDHHRKDSAAFRERMIGEAATKNDLRETEARITRAVERFGGVPHAGD